VERLVYGQSPLLPWLAYGWGGSPPYTHGVAACPQCGEANPNRARYCWACGSALESASQPSLQVRKTVTVLFCDVAESTQLGDRRDPEQMRGVMSRFFEEARTVLQRHSGTVEKFIGDAVMAVFGIPVLHEDDALRALRAADELREAMVALNNDLDRSFGIRLQIRTGVNSGEVVAGDPSRSDTLVTGEAVNVAQRLELAAAPDEILVGESTWWLARDAIRVEPVGPLELKGKEKPVQAFRLLGIVPGALPHARRLDSPMVGRAREREILRQAFDRTVEERACHLFTILGAEGVGKSRLILEFVSEVKDRATVLSGGCLPYGERITFWPVL
jgi:class 3 adenylate cyclase